MSLLASILLGLIQGLTEFLPVSSDGHLALGAILLGTMAEESTDGLFFDVLVHVATMLAVIVHFRREIVGLLAAFTRTAEGAMARRVAGLIATASVPTAIVALSIKDAAERAFHEPVLVGLGFLGTAAVLSTTMLRLKGQAASERAGDAAGVRTAAPWFEDLARMRWRDALAIGAAQGLAPWPGLSRSGTTIATALWMGVPPTTATRFSLLISLPAIAGAFLLQLRSLDGQIPSDLASMMAGFVVAGVVGYFAIGWLLKAVRHAKLPWFAAYTAVLGLVVTGLGLWGEG